MRWLAMFVLAAPLAAQKPVKPLDNPPDVDRFTKAERLIAMPSLMSGLSALGNTMVTIGWFRRVLDGDTTYFARVEYESRDWIFIPPEGVGIEFMADGQRVQLPVVGPAATQVKRASRSVTVQEVSMMRVTPAQLFAVVSADTVFWRLHGRTGFVEGRARPSNFNRLRRLLVTAFPDSAMNEGQP